MANDPSFSFSATFCLSSSITYPLYLSIFLLVSLHSISVTHTLMHFSQGLPHSFLSQVHTQSIPEYHAALIHPPHSLHSLLWHPYHSFHAHTQNSIHPFFTHQMLPSHSSSHCAYSWFCRVVLVLTFLLVGEMCIHQLMYEYVFIYFVLQIVDC